MVSNTFWLYLPGALSDVIVSKSCTIAEEIPSGKDAVPIERISKRSP
jgi:hypothetical protein